MADLDAELTSNLIRRLRSTRGPVFVNANGIDTTGLNDRQRLALAFLHRHGAMNNQQYRSLTGSDPLTATRELTGLASEGLVSKTSDRRWAVWHLTARRDAPLRPSSGSEDAGEHRRRRDRRPEIRALLAEGPLRTAELSSRLELSRAGVMRWLRRLERDGEVARTTSQPTDPTTAWQLSSIAPRHEHEQDRT